MKEFIDSIGDKKLSDLEEQHHYVFLEDLTGGYNKLIVELKDDDPDKDKLLESSEALTSCRFDEESGYILDEAFNVGTDTSYHSSAGVDPKPYKVRNIKKYKEYNRQLNDAAKLIDKVIDNHIPNKKPNKKARDFVKTITSNVFRNTAKGYSPKSLDYKTPLATSIFGFSVTAQTPLYGDKLSKNIGKYEKEFPIYDYVIQAGNLVNSLVNYYYDKDQKGGFISTKKEEEHRNHIYEEIIKTIDVYNRFMKACNSTDKDERLHADDVIDPLEKAFNFHINSDRGKGSIKSCLDAYKIGLENGWALEDIPLLASFKMVIDTLNRNAAGFPFEVPGKPRYKPGYPSKNFENYVKELEKHYEDLKKKQLKTPEDREAALASMDILIWKGLNESYLSDVNRNLIPVSYYLQHASRKKIMDLAVKNKKVNATFSPIKAKNMELLEDDFVLPRSEEKIVQDEENKIEQPEIIIQNEENKIEQPINNIQNEENKIEQPENIINPEPQKLHKKDSVVDDFIGIFNPHSLGIRQKLSQDNLVWLAHKSSEVSRTYDYSLNRRISPDNSVRMMLLADHNMTLDQVFNLGDKTEAEIKGYFEELFNKIADPNKTPVENARELGRMKAKAYNKIAESTIPSVDEPLTYDKITALRDYFDHFNSLEIDLEQDYERIDTNIAHPDMKAAFYEGVSNDPSFMANRARFMALGQSVYSIAQMVYDEQYTTASRAQALYLVKDFFKKYGGKKINEIDLKEYSRFISMYNVSRIMSKMATKDEQGNVIPEPDDETYAAYLRGESDVLPTKDNIDQLIPDIEGSTKELMDGEVTTATDNIREKGLQEYKNLFTEEVLNAENVLLLPQDVKDQITNAYYKSLANVYTGISPNQLAPVASSAFELFRIANGGTIKQYVESHYKNCTPEEKQQAMVIETMRNAFMDGIHVDFYYANSDNEFIRCSGSRVKAVSEASLDAREFSEFEKRLADTQVDRDAIFRQQDGTYLEDISNLSEVQITNMADIYDKVFNPIFSRDAVRAYKDANPGKVDLDFFRVGGIPIREYLGEEKLSNIMGEDNSDEIIKAEIMRLASDPKIPLRFTTIRHDQKKNTFKETEPYEVSDVADRRIIAAQNPHLENIDTFKEWYKKNTSLDTRSYDENDWRDLYLFDVRAAFEAGRYDKNISKQTALEQIQKDTEQAYADVDDMRADFDAHATKLMEAMTVTKRDLKKRFDEDITPEVSHNARMKKVENEYLLKNKLLAIQERFTESNIQNVINRFNKLAKEKGWKERKPLNKLSVPFLVEAINMEENKAFINEIFAEMKLNPHIFRRKGNLKEQFLSVKTPLQKDYKDRVDYPADMERTKALYQDLNNKAQTQEDKDLINRVNENLAQRNEDTYDYLLKLDNGRAAEIDHRQGQLNIDHYANDKFGPVEEQTNIKTVGKGAGLEYKIYKNPEFLNELKATPATMTEQSKAKAVAMMKKIKELGLVDKNSDIEQVNKEYIHSKMIVAKRDLMKAVESGDFAKIREANQKYEAEREKVREVFSLAKQTLGDSILAPANVTTNRNPLVPLEFSQDFITESKVNGLYQSACMCEKLGITPEQFIENPCQYMMDYIMQAAEEKGFNANNKLPGKNGFVYSFEAIFRKGYQISQGGRLANDMGFMRPTMMISRTIDGYAMLEEDPEKRAALYSYEYLAAETLENLINAEEVREKSVYNIFAHSDNGKVENQEALRNLKEGLKTAFLEGGNIEKRHIPVDNTDANGKVIPKTDYKDTLDVKDKYKDILKNFDDVVRTFKDVIDSNNKFDKQGYPWVPIEELCKVVEESMYDYLMAHPEDAKKPEYIALEKAAFSAKKKFGYEEPEVSPAETKYRTWKRKYVVEHNTLYDAAKKRDTEVNKELSALKKKHNEAGMNRVIDERMKELAREFRLHRITENYFTNRVESLLKLKDDPSAEIEKPPRFFDDSNPETYKSDVDLINKRIQNNESEYYLDTLENFKKAIIEEKNLNATDVVEISDDFWLAMYETEIIDRGIPNRPLPAGYKEYEKKIDNWNREYNGVINEFDIGVNGEVEKVQKPAKRMTFRERKTELRTAMVEKNGDIPKMLSETIGAEVYERLKGKLPNGVSEETFSRRMANNPIFKKVVEPLMQALDGDAYQNLRKETAESIIKMIDEKKIVTACDMEQKKENGVNFIKEEFTKEMQKQIRQPMMGK